MNARWTTWLAGSLWTVAMIIAACVLALRYANATLFDPLFGAIVFCAVIGSLATVGAMLVTHRPGNPIGWIFLAAALSTGIAVAASEYGRYITETAPGALPEITLLFWLGAWNYLVVFMIPPTFGTLLFPTGRLPSRRWRPFAWFIGIQISLMIFVEMFSPGPLDPEPDGGYSQFTNPVGIEAMTGVFDVLLAVDELAPLGLVPFIGAIVSIGVRLRGATAVERQQIKWFAYAAAIPLLGILIEQAIYASSDTSTKGDATAGSYVAILGIAVLPIAIGIAILRHNLYDIDRLISRTLVYGSLTLLLGLSFTGSVILLQILLSPLTRDNDLAIAGSTLLIFALLRPVRQRLQSFVDRRFYRRAYDAARTVEAFSARLREHSELDRLRDELLAVVDETMQPATASLWLREPEIGQ